MVTLVLVVDPCPVMPGVNPPGLSLNVTCSAFPNLRLLTAIPFSFTISGPTDPNSALFLSCLVATADYGDLCNHLRNGNPVQITLLCDQPNGFIVVRQLSSKELTRSDTAEVLQEIKASSERIETTTQHIEREVSLTVLHELSQIKAQLAHIITRLPTLTAPGPTQHVSGYPSASASEETAEDPERVLFGNG